jgi:hypothetical protein
VRIDVAAFVMKAVKLNAYLPQNVKLKVNSMMAMEIKLEQTAHILACFFVDSFTLFQKMEN